MIADYLWLIATGGGALLLGLALAYGMSKQRRLSRNEKNARSAKVDELYKR
ncbi:hypothetical protein LJR030_002942 [Rhizobium sp. LjRoot30]|uniref:hypothetical protein n=1 Tax=Rhizobium sp. LjRoot30 TaxID=3342320 RepID=UPI003ED06496